MNIYSYAMSDYQKQHLATDMLTSKHHTTKKHALCQKTKWRDEITDWNVECKVWNDEMKETEIEMTIQDARLGECRLNETKMKG